MKKKLLTLTFTLVLLIGLVAAMGMNASAATCPIEGATGTGTEADPVIVDNMEELEKALEYNGTLHVVAKNFATSNITLSVPLPYVEISSKKVLYLKQDLEIRQINGAKGSLFSVKDGGDLTIIADDVQKVKYTNTVLELAGSTAKATLKGKLRLETTTDDGTLNSYALVAHQGKVLIDGENLRISSASLQNGAAILKNGHINGKVALKGKAFNLYRGSVGFFNDNDTAFTEISDFGTAGVVREDLRAACIGGFNEQNPALETDSYTTGIKLTADKEKFFLGVSKKYSFKTANNTAWAEEFVYTPTGTIEVTDSAGNVIYSKTDSDSGISDKNVSLSIDLKDVINTAGEYKVKETLKLTRDGKLVTQHVNVYPIEVVEFNTFLGQSPAMPAGKTEHYLGGVTQSSYPIAFYAHSLSSAMIAEGYTSNAILKIYNENDSYVYGEKAYCDKGQKISYDLNSLPADIYRLVETIELRDKNNKVVKSAENTFTIDWTPQQDIKEVNITANWQGAVTVPVSATKGVKVTYYRWEKLDGSDWNDFTGTINGGRFRCTVELTAESGYTLASGYTVKIGGIKANRYTGNRWYVARDITGYVNFVDIEHSNAPEAGAYPEFEGYEIVQAGNTAVKLVEWYKCDKNGKKLSEPLTEDDMFEKDSYYRLEVTVVPSADYEFKNDAVFYINNAPVNYNTSHGIDIPGSITGYKVYNVNDAEGKYELYLYDGNQTDAAKNIIIKDGQYIASNSATPVTTKPSGGYAYYKNGVLTFEAYINTKAHFVFEEGNLDVYLKGRNRIGAIYNSEYLGTINGLDARKGNMTISADAKASLTVASNPLDAYCNIYVNTLTFNSGKVISCLDNGTYGSAIYAEKLIIADGYKAYVGETNNFDASEEWNGIADIKAYKNVWLDEDVCRHSLHKYEKTAASCIYEGYKETFEVCEKCYLYVVKEDGTVLTETEVSEFLEGVVIPKTGKHTGGTATCTTKAKCSVCGEAYGSVNKANHKSLTTLKAVAATCTKEGKTEGKKCSVCGTVTVAQKAVAKKAHSYKTVTTKATLTKNGKTESKCSCGAVKSGSTKTVYYPKTIKLEYTSVIYNGKTKTPSVSVKDYKGNKLKKDTDYTVKYASGRKSTGKYSVTITFKGKYSGTKTLYFNILPSKTSKITPTCSTTEIKASWSKVTGASGYKVELLNSKGKVVKKVTTTKTYYTFKKLSKVTTYKIRVTAYKTIDKKAAYSGVSTTITTSTAPAKVSLSKVTAGSKSATPAWKTVSGASGYEVQYSTSSKFKSAKTATVKKGSSKKTTIKKLTKGKKYYFKVRAYKTVGNVKVYGAWSAVKNVKVK